MNDLNENENLKSLLTKSKLSKLKKSSFMDTAISVRECRQAFQEHWDIADRVTLVDSVDINNKVNAPESPIPLSLAIEHFACPFLSWLGQLI
ncbi:unnamed protein product [Onchocerca flexuosa]|uniref:Uncharacterized protein n=1 Tax=Onchocerca flexuosa TaxID=387005 RepID=A0A183H060_9BILA|nr:unnamed protein product [Onchocerca flexuosa]